MSSESFLKTPVPEIGGVCRDCAHQCLAGALRLFGSAGVAARQDTRVHTIFIAAAAMPSKSVWRMRFVTPVLKYERPSSAGARQRGLDLVRKRRTAVSPLESALQVSVSMFRRCCSSVRREGEGAWRSSCLRVSLVQSDQCVGIRSAHTERRALNSCQLVLARTLDGIESPCTAHGLFVFRDKTAALLTRIAALRVTGSRCAARHEDKRGSRAHERMPGLWRARRVAAARESAQHEGATAVSQPLS